MPIKILKSFVIVLSIIAIMLIIGVFGVNIAFKDKIYTANITKQDAVFKDDYFNITARINFDDFAPLLRSAQIAKITINQYAWDKNVAISEITDISNGGRNIWFKTTQDMQDFSNLGSVDYHISFIPLIKTILKYYLALLCLSAFVLGIFKGDFKECYSAIIQSVSFNVGISFFAFVVSLFVIASLGFIVNINITQIYVYVSLLISLFVLFFRNPYKKYSLICYVIFMLFAMFMAYYIYDYSWDGRAYHQMGIFYLANNWNPIYQQMQDVTHLSSFLSHSIWIEHYLKFAEITQSCIYKAFGFIESGKIINWLFAFGAFLYGIATISRLKFLSMKQAILLSFLAVFSPVVMAQISTYYIDGLLGIGVIFIVLSMLDLELESKRYKYGIFILALLATASIKLTGIAYAGFIGIVYLCYKIYLKSYKDSRNIIISGVIAFALIICCNVNPLLTNQLHHGHFGYPLMGKDKIDIIASQQPANFNGDNRFEKLGKSLFSKTQNVGRTDKSHFKVPFIKTKGERLSDPDTRVAGFGYFFGGIIILCILLVALNIRRFLDRKFIFYFGVILGSTLINPECWWARYVPQMWLLPFVIMIFSYSFEVNKISKIIRNASIFFMILSFVFTATLPLNRGYKNSIESQLAHINTNEVFIYLPIKMEQSFGIKLLDRGIKAQMLDKQHFEKLSQEMPFYKLYNVLDNYDSNQSYWSVEASTKDLLKFNKKDN